MKKVKLILIGEGKVGKTSIIKQFVDETFLEEYIQTFSNDKFLKNIEIDDKNNTELTLEIWDTLGQENSRVVNKIFMKNANIGLLVYDITNQKSFDDLDVFLSQVDEIIGKENIVLGVVANKSDLYEEKVVSTEEGEEYAKKINALFFETSAKDNEVIQNLFKTISIEYAKKNNLIKINLNDNENLDSNNISNKKDISNINEETNIESNNILKPLNNSQSFSIEKSEINNEMKKKNEEEERCC